MNETRIHPFYCGSQMGDWQTANCQNCHLQGYYRDQEKQSDWVWRCDIQQAIGEAYMGDGTVSAEIGKRMGADPERFGWRCGELVTIEPIAQYEKRFQRSQRKLRPLWRRLRNAASFAREMWNPWWQPEVDIYGFPGRISLLLAWTVAWGIHHDDQELIHCKGCGRTMPEVQA